MCIKVGVVNEVVGVSVNKRELVGVVIKVRVVPNTYGSGNNTTLFFFHLVQ